MKYARIQDGRTVDVVNTANYEPRPDWGQTDETLLSRIYIAVGGFNSFIRVPDYVLPGMTDNGDGSYNFPAPEAEGPPEDSGDGQ